MKRRKGFYFKEENFFKEEKLKQGFELFQKACEAGSGKACFRLADDIYRYGIEKIGVKADADKAFSFYSKSCDLSYADGCSWLGAYYERQEDVAKARDFYKKTCSLQNEEKCSNIEKLKELEKIAVMNYEQLISACSAGMSRACYRKEDIDTFKAFQENCQKEGAYSCFVVANRYLIGKWVEKDLNQAINFYEKACKVGYLKACSEVAHCRYEKNNDYSKALAIYQNGCDMNEGLACFYLGALYERGKGVEKKFRSSY